ncbi:hypothetical protein [Parafrankia sp. EAN1pec]|uniref:hypothetical protein n=1 Tax=Parafrankia sp. (strain EAN1pec) TaxID=298653 RepID=UPI00321B5FDD
MHSAKPSAELPRLVTAAFRQSGAADLAARDTSEIAVRLAMPREQQIRSHRRDTPVPEYARR